MEEIIKTYVIKTMFQGKRSVTNDESLFQSGMLDSIQHLKLVSFIEKQFKVSIAMHELTVENFDSISNIAKLIKLKMPGT
jgi:acyl carrier protein